MIVKICGITTTEAALTAEASGANMVGFVFAPSTRQISPERAAEIASILPSSIQKVGLFVNERVEKIVKIAKLVGLDFIQLHGDEPARVAEQIPFPIIKAFSIDKADQQTISTYPCDYLLIDSPSKKFRGGSGTVFDWDRLNALTIDKKKLILAGGLSPENIKEAIQAVEPAGVDVSSGVETDGIKDNEKIHRFIKNAKAITW